MSDGFITHVNIFLLAFDPAGQGSGCTVSGVQYALLMRPFFQWVLGYV